MSKNIRRLVLSTEVQVDRDSRYIRVIGSKDTIHMNPLDGSFYVQNEHGLKRNISVDGTNDIVYNMGTFRKDLLYMVFNYHARDLEVVLYGKENVSL